MTTFQIFQSKDDSSDEEYVFRLWDSGLFYQEQVIILRSRSTHKISKVGIWLDSVVPEPEDPSNSDLLSGSTVSYRLIDSGCPTMTVLPRYVKDICLLLEEYGEDLLDLCSVAFRTNHLFIGTEGLFSKTRLSLLKEVWRAPHTGLAEW